MSLTGNREVSHLFWNGEFSHLFWNGEFSHLFWNGEFSHLFWNGDFSHLFWTCKGGSKRWLETKIASQRARPHWDCYRKKNPEL